MLLSQMARRNEYLSTMLVGNHRMHEMVSKPNSKLLEGLLPKELKSATVDYKK